MQANLHKLACCCALVLVACLGPDPEDAVDLTKDFGDPTLANEADALHVESKEAQALDPKLVEKVGFFSTSAAYVAGFANGQRIWYWNVDGLNATFIAPLYEITGKEGIIGRQIIDVIPGDGGYTPWWRRNIVRTTAKFDALAPAERPRIWSRQGIDSAIQLGYVTAPEPTNEVLDCPVMKQGTKIALGIPPDGSLPAEATTTWVWYRKQRVDWVCFSGPKIVEPITKRDMPAFPVYVLQRIDEALPIYELATGVDLDGDGILNHSNNIFPDGPAMPQTRYSPLWYAALVRTEPDYVSIETVTTSVGISAERDFLPSPPEDLREATPLPPVVGKIAPFEEQLVNCPIQVTKGQL